MTKKIFVFKEKLLILSWETCRWALSCSSWWSWPANGVLSVCSCFPLSDSLMITSLSCFTPFPLLKKQLGNRDTQDDSVLYLNHLVRPVSVFNKLSERNWVFSEIQILLSIQFYATDSAYCKSFLTRCTDCIRKMEKEKNGGSSTVFLKSQNNCLVIMRHSNQISFPNDLDTMLQSMGFPGGASGKAFPCQYRKHTRCRFDPWVGKMPWKRAWQPTPIFLPGESQGQRGLGGYSP